MDTTVDKEEYKCIVTVSGVWSATVDSFNNYAATTVCTQLGYNDYYSYNSTS